MSFLPALYHFGLACVALAFGTFVGLLGFKDVALWPVLRCCGSVGLVGMVLSILAFALLGSPADGVTTWDMPYFLSLIVSSFVVTALIHLISRCVARSAL